MTGNKKKEDKRINTYHEGISGKGSKLAITACQNNASVVMTLPILLKSCAKVTLVTKQSDSSP